MVSTSAQSDMEVINDDTYVPSQDSRRESSQDFEPGLDNISLSRHFQPLQAGATQKGMFHSLFKGIFRKLLSMVKTCSLVFWPRKGNSLFPSSSPKGRPTISFQCFKQTHRKLSVLLLVRYPHFSTLGESNGQIPTRIFETPKRST